MKAPDPHDYFPVEEKGPTVKVPGTCFMKVSCPSPNAMKLRFLLHLCSTSRPIALSVWKWLSANTTAGEHRAICQVEKSIHVHRTFWDFESFMGAMAMSPEETNRQIIWCVPMFSRANVRKQMLLANGDSDEKGRLYSAWCAQVCWKCVPNWLNRFAEDNILLYLTNIIGQRELLSIGKTRHFKALDKCSLVRLLTIMPGLLHIQVISSLQVYLYTAITYIITIACNFEVELFSYMIL